MATNSIPESFNSIAESLKTILSRLESIEYSNEDAGVSSDEVIEDKKPKSATDKLKRNFSKLFSKEKEQKQSGSLTQVERARYKAIFTILKGVLAPPKPEADKLEGIKGSQIVKAEQVQEATKKDTEDTGDKGGSGLLDLIPTLLTSFAKTIPEFLGGFKDLLLGLGGGLLGLGGLKKLLSGPGKGKATPVKQSRAAARAEKKAADAGVKRESRAAKQAEKRRLKAEAQAEKKRLKTEAQAKKTADQAEKRRLKAADQAEKRRLKTEAAKPKAPSKPTITPSKPTTPPSKPKAPSKPMTPTTGSKNLPKLGKLANVGKGVLGKAALPLALGMAGYDAVGGFNADKDAGVGKSLGNAVRSMSHGLTFGLLGSSSEEIAADAEAKKLQKVAGLNTSDGKPTQLQNMNKTAINMMMEIAGFPAKIIGILQKTAKVSDEEQKKVIDSKLGKIRAPLNAEQNLVEMDEKLANQQKITDAAAAVNAKAFADLDASARPLSKEQIKAPETPLPKGVKEQIKAPKPQVDVLPKVVEDQVKALDPGVKEQIKAPKPQVDVLPKVVEGEMKALEKSSMNLKPKLVDPDKSKQSLAKEQNQPVSNNFQLETELKQINEQQLNVLMIISENIKNLVTMQGKQPNRQERVNTPQESFTSNTISKEFTSDIYAPTSNAIPQSS